MKKQLLLLALFVLAGVAIAANYQQLDTVHADWKLLRAEADEDTAIDLTSAGDYDNIPSSAVPLRTADDGTGNGGNGIEIVFCGGSAANKTFTYKVYMWRRTNGMARMVVTGTGTLGTQAVVEYPSGDTATAKYWADILTVSRTNWMASAESTDETGHNEVASIKFDGCGYEWIYVEITSADGATGNEAGDVSAYYSYY